jgi:hypothetical protein
VSSQVETTPDAIPWRVERSPEEFSEEDAVTVGGLHGFSEGQLIRRSLSSTPAQPGPTVRLPPAFASMSAVGDLEASGDEWLDEAGAGAGDVAVGDEVYAGTAYRVRGREL